MPRREKRYHFLYKTTNLLNGKYYVGMHTTDDMDDGYLGSGLRLKRSIKKYGVENFKREVLEFFEDRKLMAAREREVVNEKLLEDTMCMNIMKGGEGGRGYISAENQRARSVSGGKSRAKRLIEDVEFRAKHVERSSKHFKKLHENGVINYDTFSGRKHRTESISKMSAMASKRIGERNSQFGSCWITNGKENKKIKKETPVPEGWYKGRI